MHKLVDKTKTNDYVIIHHLVRPTWLLLCFDLGLAASCANSLIIIILLYFLFGVNFYLIFSIQINIMHINS